MSWVGGDKIWLVDSSLAILLNLKQHLVHKFAKLRAGAVVRQRFFPVVCLVDLALRNTASLTHARRTERKGTVKVRSNRYV